MKVSVVQHPPVYLNLNASVTKAVDLIAEAGSQGAEVIAFPETWLPGYPVWLDFAPGAALWDHPPAKALYRLLVENAVTLDGDALASLKRAAGRAGATVVMGAHERWGARYTTLCSSWRRTARVSRCTASLCRLTPSV